VWRDDGYQGRLDKILVMGISDRDTIKRFFEAEFVKELKTRGAVAVEAYTVFPAGEMLTKDTMASKLNDMDIHSVIITRVVEKKTVDTYVPGQMYPHYSRSYGYARSPGYSVKDEVVVLETSIYDVKNEKLIWSALSDTFVEGSSDKLIQEFIKLIIDNLAKQNLLG
jgi:hypothetical protein